MNRQSNDAPRVGPRVRRLAIRIAIAILVLEAVYLIAGNLCIRMGLIETAFNSTPEADFVSWESGVTYLPGHFSFKGLTYRGQTRGSQTYFHLSELDARVSLRRLLAKRLHIRGLEVKDVDYRYRDRIDFPCWTEESGEPFPGIPPNFEYFPEIPGLENPPDPKPEDIYPEEDGARPWKIDISGARVNGTVRVAYNEIRLEGQGSVEGGLTAILKETSAITRANVRVVPATLLWGPRVVTENLDLEADVAVAPFPSECAETSEIIGGLTGRLKVSGHDADGFTVNVGAFNSYLPGQGVLSIESGTGKLGGSLEFSEGMLSIGELDLTADDVILKRQDIPLHGNLEVHAILKGGDLATNRYDLSGTIFRLDDIAKSGTSEKHQEKLEPWFGALEFEEGFVSFGRPMTVDSHVRLTMHDTRPVLALLRNFTDELEWLPLTRNAKGIDGWFDLEFGEGFLTFDNLHLTGENVEILGWIHIRDQKKTGRIFARHGLRSAAVAFDGGKSKIVTIGSRRWFENQQSPPLDVAPPEPPPTDLK